MKRTNKIWISITTCMCLICMALGIWHFTGQGYKVMREKHPLISNAQYQLDNANLDFESRMALAPILAEIEVVDRLPDYTITIQDPEVDVLWPDVKFRQYKVRILKNISESTVKTDSDGCIVICFAEEFEENYPELTPGLTAICSLQPAKGSHIGKYLFFDKSFYYTEDNLTLSAYESDDSPARNGCRKAVLIERIQKLRG